MKYLHMLMAIVAVLLGSTAAFAEGGVPTPDVPEAAREAGPNGCVEPVEVMRKRHMEFIMHQRDETMHRGIRTTKHSLKECINCHVVEDESGQPVSIQSEKHFCNSCHQYAAVHIDCFQCHASTPSPGPSAKKRAASLFDSVISAPAGN